MERPSESAFLRGRGASWLTALALLIFTAGPRLARAEESESAGGTRILVLSGGGSPESNHHSQYLQTKTLADWLVSRFGPAPVAIYFGAGNRTDAPALTDDVSVTTEMESDFASFIPGKIAGNHPATPEALQDYWAELAGEPHLQKLFLFVSDHGGPSEQADPPNTDNRIDLWGTHAELSRSELALKLEALAPEHTTYVMSQCYSGGFHELAVLRNGAYPTIAPGICGFTATMPDTMASGCTSFVDGKSYQGYERFFTEELTGRDVVTGQARRHGPRRSIRDAHYAARLRDLTLDEPTASSEYFLTRWGQTISRPDFRPRSGTRSASELREILNAFKKRPVGETAWLGQGTVFEEFFRQSERAIAAAIRGGGLRELSAPGSLDDPQPLRERIIQRETSDQGRLGDLENRLLHARFDRLTPLWTKAFAQDRALVPPAQRSFEARAQEIENISGGTKFGSNLYGIIGTRLRVELKSFVDPETARAFEGYFNDRLARISAWGLKSGTPEARAVAAEIVSTRAELAAIERRLDAYDRALDLLKRISVIREQEAAAEALLASGDAEALADFASLRNCEAGAVIAPEGAR